MLAARGVRITEVDLLEDEQELLVTFWAAEDLTAMLEAAIPYHWHPATLYGQKRQWIS